MGETTVLQYFTSKTHHLPLIKLDKQKGDFCFIKKMTSNQQAASNETAL
jgi:hypothetical protein